MTSAHVIGAGTLGFQLAESSWQAGYWRNILFAGWPWSGHRNTEGEVGMAAGEAQSFSLREGNHKSGVGHQKPL